MFRLFFILFCFKTVLYSVEIVDVTPKKMPINVTNAVAWHPIKNIVIIGNLHSRCGVYKIDHETRTIEEISQLPDENVFSLAWHPTGNYLTVGTSGKNKFYFFDQTTHQFTPLEITNSFNLFNVTHGLFWNPEGTLLFTANEKLSFTLKTKKPISKYFNRIYSFENYKFTEIEFINPISQLSQSVELSPCGQFLAVGNITLLNAPDDLLRTSHIYFMNWESQEYTCITPKGLGAVSVHKATWSPCGRFLAIAGDGYNKGESNKLYAFNGKLTDITPLDPDHSFVKQNVSHVISWSPSGNFLFVGNAFGELNQLFAFNKETFTLTDLSECFSAFHIDNGTHDFTFSPCSNYIMLANDGFVKPKIKKTLDDPYTFISNFKHKEKQGQQNQLLFFKE